MKKLLAILISINCILGCFCFVRNQDKFVYRADDDFASNEDYYNELCVTRGLDEATTRLCARFRKYVQGQADRVKSEINSLTAQMNNIRDDIINQGRKINEINSTISSVENQIRGLEIQIKTIEENINQITLEIIEREKKIEELNDGIKERMVALQARVSLNSYIGFIMGANNFVDLLRRVSAINEFTDYDVSKIREMEAEKELLEADKRELQNQKDERAKKRADLEAYKTDLYTLKRRAEELLAEYRRKEAELNRVRDNLQISLDDLRNKIENIDDALSGYYPSEGFIRPVAHAWISSSCPYYAPGNPSSGFHPAADMATGVGTYLYAVANGYVVATRGGCGWGYLGNNCNGGFGNYIVYMIEINGTSYFIINAHLSEIYVNVGDVVHQGREVIGLTGNSGSTSGPHLHIEVIRFGNVGIKEAVRMYSNVGRIYYTLGRNIYSTCEYRGAPCYEDALKIFGVYYGMEF